MKVTSYNLDLKRTRELLPMDMERWYLLEGIGILDPFQFPN